MIDIASRARYWKSISGAGTHSGFLRNLLKPKRFAYFRFQNPLWVLAKLIENLSDLHISGSGTHSGFLRNLSKT